MKLRRLPDPILGQRCVAVTRFDDDLKRFVRNMDNLMVHNNGVGIAAPQAGKTTRMFIYRAMNGEHLTLINPEITEVHGQQQSNEGCLSIPRQQFRVLRPYTLVVKGQDLEGKDIEVKGRGYLATVLSHEIDHLNGLLISREMPVEN